MRRVILVRHGATDYAGTFCGQIDPDLNPLGEVQAMEAAAALSGSGIQAVYSSDLCRASKTAHAIAERFGLPHCTLPDLREIAFGEWEGLHWNEIETRFPEQARLWLSEYPSQPAPGGESMKDFSHRVLHVMRSVLAESDAPACIVSHGGVLRVVLTQLFGMTEKQAWSVTQGYGQMIDVGG